MHAPNAFADIIFPSPAAQRKLSLDDRVTYLEHVCMRICTGCQEIHSHIGNPSLADPTARYFEGKLATTEQRLTQFPEMLNELQEKLQKFERRLEDTSKAGNVQVVEDRLLCEGQANHLHTATKEGEEMRKQADMTTKEITELRQEISRLRLQMDALSSNAKQDIMPQMQEQEDGTPQMQKPEDSGLFTKAKLDMRTTSYAVQESTWDSGIFLGFHCLGGPTAGLLILSMLATIAVQVCLICVVYANFYEEPIDDDTLQGMLHWRSLAHDVNLADSRSGTSMVAQVCSGEPALMMSTSQALHFDDLNNFHYPTFDLFANLNGPVLLYICLTLWFFSILHDIMSNFNFTYAVLVQPRGTPYIQEDEGTISIKSFNLLQVAFVVCLISLPRLAISVSLGWTGIFFLTYTTSVGDLLLNAVALVFVLEVDEMLFDPLTPRRVKRLTRMVEPLMVPDEKASIFDKGGVAAFIIRIVAVSLSVMVGHLVVIEPHNEKTHLALHYLCGGRKDFVFSTNKVTGLVFFSEKSEESDVDYDLSYAKHAILSLAELNVKNAYPEFKHEKNLATNLPFPQLHALHIGSPTYSASTLMCADMLEESSQDEADPFITASREILEKSLGIKGMENCSQMSFTEQCLSPDSAQARSLCAAYCGCSSPWSGQFYAPGRYGCPPTCSNFWNINAYYLIPPRIAADTDECEDVQDSVLAEEPSWQLYVNGVMGYLKVLLGNVLTAEELQMMEFGLTQAGCTILQSLRAILDLCSAGGPYRSARLWCPATCACSLSDMRECPRSCAFRYTFEILVDRPCNYGSEVLSQAECSQAYLQSCETNCFHYDIDFHLAVKGCWFDVQKRSLIWSHGNKTADMFAMPSLASVCRKMAPMSFDAYGPGASVGLLGSAAAECTLQQNYFDWGSETCTSS